MKFIDFLHRTSPAQIRQLNYLQTHSEDRKFLPVYSASVK